MEPKDRIIVVLDVDLLDKTPSLVETLMPYIGMFYISNEFLMTVLARMISSQSNMWAHEILTDVRTLFDTLDGRLCLDSTLDGAPSTIGESMRILSKLDTQALDKHGSVTIDSPPDGQELTLPAYTAILAGATYLTIGRPITNAADPVMAAKRFAATIALALETKASRQRDPISSLTIATIQGGAS